MFTGIALSLLAVDLLKYLDSLLVTLFYVVHADIGLIKFGDMDIVDILTAAERVVANILGKTAYLDIRELLTAVKRPASDTFNGRRDSYLLQ